MAKRSQKRNVHHERGQAGCMWGLMSLFDFRQGRSNRKLLSDRKHGSARHASGAGNSRGKLQLVDFEETNEGNNDHDETKPLIVDVGKTSVKKLMEVDMSSEQQTKKQSPSVANQQIQSDSHHVGQLEKNHKQTKKTCKVASDIDIQDPNASDDLESREPCCPESFEQFSHLDLAVLMEEFCNQIHQRQAIHLRNENVGDSCDAQETTNHVRHNQLDELDMQLVQKHSVLQEKLTEAAEAFLNQKFTDRHQSKLFMDALDILHSNKELLVRLLKDSNSLLVKHIQDQQDSQSGKVGHNRSPSEERIDISMQGEELGRHKEVSKHNIHNIFRRNKSHSRNNSRDSEDSQALNHIVILKPNQTGIPNSVTTSNPSSPPQSLKGLKNQGSARKLNSQFSLSEIKRRLKHAMRESKKERHWIFMDGVLDRIPSKRHDSGNGGRDVPQSTNRELPTTTNVHTEEMTKPSLSGESGEKISVQTDNEVASTSTASSRDLAITREGNANLRVSSIYVEAKKHLADMLSNGDVNGDFSNIQVPKTLGRILSLPEYDFSPVLSPGRDKAQEFITAQMRFSPYGKFRIVNENKWGPGPNGSANHPSPSRKNKHIQECVTENDNPEIKPQEFESTSDAVEELLSGPEIHESTSSSEADSSPKGNIEIEEVTNAASMEANNFMDEPSELEKSTSIMSTRTTKICEEEESSKCLDSPTTAQPRLASFGSLSSSSSFIQKGEDLESGIDNTPERPSPVSVLDPIFLEDFNSPTSAVSQSAEVPLQSLHIHFEEQDCSSLVVTSTNLENYSRTCTEQMNSIFEYVTTVLQASDMDLDYLVKKFHSSELLLDPSLFDEVEVSHSKLLYGDPKIIFDSTNEVLEDVCERYFGCTPWVEFVHPDIRPAPLGKGIIQEVWEGINWHLLPQHLPRSLDQIVGKDMEKERMWMDFRSDTESIGIEMTEIILEELMEDTILGLCS